jgi:hypothetical protein
MSQHVKWTGNGSSARAPMILTNLLMVSAMP